MIDAHTHLSDPRLMPFAEDLAYALQRAGLKRAVLGGVSQREWETQFKLSKLFPGFVTPVIGMHPWTVRDGSGDQLEMMFEVLKIWLKDAAALGEVGVDFYPTRNLEQVQKQTSWCRRQLQLAEEQGKPVVLHIVRGHDVIQSLLKNYQLGSVMIHGFRGGAKQAQFYLDRDFYLSLGMRSFKNLQLTDLDWLPKNRFLLESDAPSPRDDTIDCEAVCAAWLTSLEYSASFLARLWSLPNEAVWAMAEENLNRFLNRSNAVTIEEC